MDKSKITPSQKRASLRKSHNRSEMVNKTLLESRSDSESDSSYSQNEILNKQVLSNHVLNRIDADFLRICKQSFIAGLSLRNGPIDVAMDKFHVYQKALNNYIMLSLEELYLPLEQQLDSDSKPAAFVQLRSENNRLNRRISKLINHPSEKVAFHRTMISSAITQIDSLMMAHHDKEKSILYPLVFQYNPI